MRTAPRTVLLSIAGAAALLAAAVAIYVDRLAREVEDRWESYHRDVPSRVYSAPVSLYPGRDLQEIDFFSTLESLDYRETDSDPDPGSFRRGEGEVLLHLRDFRYPEPEGRFRGFPLEIRMAEGRIASMRDARTDRPVYDVDLEPLEIASYYDSEMVNRTPVTLDEVPVELVQAVLAVEDRRYFRHDGLDVLRIAGAALSDLRHGRLAEGGSTLTQQLVKNLFLSHEKSFERKVREAIMAVVLEARHDKREILEAYLNEVYMGQVGPVSIVGVGQAARHYFSRDVSRLDLAESALLAGMIRSPNRYDPGSHPEAARGRRNQVLSLMEEQGRLLTGREQAERTALPVSAARRPLNVAPYFVDYVTTELGERFPRDALSQEGYRIFTTLDPRAQGAAERAVREGLTALRTEHPWLRRDTISGRAPVQAALVALDPRTGELKAMVGGAAYGTSQFNRAARARRQPGSLFKPFVYLTALGAEGGSHTLATRIADSSFTVESGGRSWTPVNADGREHGTVDLREALTRSYNVATARLALDVGLEEIIGTARRLGLAGDLQPVPSAALGAFEVTPLEMATAYGALAGGGIRADPLSVLQVVDPGGEVLRAEGLRVTRVAEAGPVYLVNRALQDVLYDGTAARARRLGYRGDASGKTGTTSGFRDAWFVGYTPELVTLVWVGFDDNRSLRLEGSEAALPIWLRFTRAYGAHETASFRAPEGIVRVDIDNASGKRGDPSCGPSRTELFLEGTEPEESCADGDGWWIF